MLRKSHQTIASGNSATSLPVTLNAWFINRCKLEAENEIKNRIILRLSFFGTVQG